MLHQRSLGERANSLLIFYQQYRLTAAFRRGGNSVLLFQRTPSMRGR